MSDEFFDNFTLALVRAGDAEAKKDLSSELINNYFEKAAVNIPQVKENATIEEYVKTLAEIGKRQAAQEGVDFATIINAFALDELLFLFSFEEYLITGVLEE